MTVKHEHVLITGGTGNLGGELLLRLLSESRPPRITALVRPRSEVAGQNLNSTPEDRLRERLPGIDLSGVRVLEADLFRAGAALAPEDLRDLERSVDAIVHCAANTSLRQGHTSAQRANVAGTAAILSLALRCAHLERFVHVSTAYIAGDRTGVVREDELIAGQRFLNAYEQSKYDAELHVRTHGAHLPIVVARPSIVLGDSRSGHRSGSAPIIPVLRHVASGRLRAFPGWGSTRLDLVPLDYVADAMHRLLGEPGAVGRTFHLAAGKRLSVRARRLFELTIDLVGRHPERPLCFEGDGDPMPRPSTGRIFEGLSCYFDYLCFDKDFDDSDFRSLVGPQFQRCPDPERYLPVVLRAALARPMRRSRRAVNSTAIKLASC